MAPEDGQTSSAMKAGEGTAGDPSANGSSTAQVAQPKEEKAAVKIQSIHRGRQARWETLPKSHTRPLKDDDEEEVDCAIGSLVVKSHTRCLQAEDEEDVADALECLGEKIWQKPLKDEDEEDVSMAMQQLPSKRAQAMASKTSCRNGTGEMATPSYALDVFRKQFPVPGGKIHRNDLLEVLQRVARQSVSDAEIISVLDATSSDDFIDLETFLSWVYAPAAKSAAQGKDEPRWLIFYHWSASALAQKVQAIMGRHAQLSEVAWRQFDDGFPDLEIPEDDVESLQNISGTCLILSLHDPKVIFEQMSLLYLLPGHRARNLHIILPWFCTGTMERVETTGQVATASSLARMMSACPAGPTGPPTVVVYDIHALQEEFYFTSNVLVQLKTAVWLLKETLERLSREAASEDIAIAFPDDGAHKRFKEKFEGFPLIVCSKVRDGDARRVVVKEGQPLGKHCVIVDDLVQSGGTLLECAKPLKEKGAVKVSCFVTHGVFPKESFKKFIGHPLIHKFWITDSIPTTVAHVQGKAPFEVLSLASLIAEYLLSAC